MKSKEVILRESAIFSSKASQPILCYGRLLEHGWGINGREQLLENGDLQVPLHLQNKSLVVHGRVRVIKDNDEDCLEVQVPEALEQSAGWKFNKHGMLVGSLLTSRFVDPTFIPEIEDSPNLMRTTIIRKGKKWVMVEYCEEMMRKEELDELYFEEKTVVPSMTTFSYELAPPDMGLFAEGYERLEAKEGREKVIEKAVEDLAPSPPVEAVVPSWESLAVAPTSRSTLGLSITTGRWSCLMPKS